MRPSTRFLALAACLVVAGTVAHADSTRRHGTVFDLVKDRESKPTRGHSRTHAASSDSHATAAVDRDDDPVAADRYSDDAVEPHRHLIEAEPPKRPRYLGSKPAKKPRYTADDTAKDDDVLDTNRNRHNRASNGPRYSDGDVLDTDRSRRDRASKRPSDDDDDAVESGRSRRDRASKRARSNDDDPVDTGRSKRGRASRDRDDDDAVPSDRAKGTKRVKASRYSDDDADTTERSDDDETAKPSRTKGRKAAKVSKHDAADPVAANPSADAVKAEPVDVDADPNPAERTRNRAGRTPGLLGLKAVRTTPPRESDDADADRVAFAAPDGDSDGNADAARDKVDDDRDEKVSDLDSPVTLRKGTARTANDWRISIGPYVWASSVQANVSLGSTSVSAGVDFLDLKRYARYGGELLAEARYRRFSVSGDLIFANVGITGASNLGPVMVNLEGTADSVLVDGMAGYTLVGNDTSMLSVEARAGLRYQRTSVSTTVEVADNEMKPSKIVDAARDTLAGGRVFLRPRNRFFLSSTFDVGVIGRSKSTWSAAADASVRITPHVLLSLGYRTLTLERTNLSIVMHGPRAAVQFTF